ncbi:MAG: phosphoribosylaminoimidazole carboxylase, ATPase subunit [Pseudomonadota bacterium]|jgi:5-(carboxyamino)imidazole ribonucleotide synthase
MISPPAILGMLGGGQLGRFFVIAAHELGYRVMVLDPDPGSPAGRIADEHLVAQYDDEAALQKMAASCAAVTTEFENVPSATLAYLARHMPVSPAAECVAIAQHRIREKTFLRDHGFPIGPFAVIESAADLDAVPPTFFPAVLKVARFGYDGKGQVRVSSLDEARAAFAGFQGEPCVLEKFLPLSCEVSVVLARNREGDARCFPLAENQHRAGILDVSIVPARVPSALAAEAASLALSLAESLGYVGVMAVEFFVSEGRLLVNEIAPRPHNSGHYTLDACAVSQFEQQVRVLTGLPLGETAAHSAAVMVNLLGDVWLQEGKSAEPAWQKILQVPALKLHLYGKFEARAGRKMGHFTVLGRQLDATLDAALKARTAIGVADDSGR